MSILVRYANFCAKKLRKNNVKMTRFHWSRKSRDSCPTSSGPYPNLRAVLDCTEFYIKKPSRPSSQRQTYSGYKSGNTFKLLVSLSSICHINFISKLYTGSISDKSIVQKSGFLDALQSGDAVMTDKVRIF